MDPVLGLGRDGGTCAASRHDSNGPLSPWTERPVTMDHDFPSPLYHPNHRPMPKKTSTMPGALVERRPDDAG